MMNNYVEFKDKIAFHPGYYIKEYIDDLGITQEEFAIRLGTTPKNISVLLKGEQSLSVEIAAKLSRMLGTSVKFWLNLQSEYDSLLVEKSEQDELDRERNVFNVINYKYFVDHFGFPELPRKINEQIIKVREFLKVSSLTVFEKTEIGVSFRSSNLEIFPKNIIKANIMVQIATNKALEYKNTPKYNKKMFVEAIEYVLTLTEKHDEFYRLIEKKLYECGVILVLLPNIEGSKVNGATRKIGDKMMIMMNDGKNDSDSFWFTLFHEFGHLVNGDYGVSYNYDIEDEADRFAKDMLIDKDKYTAFIKNSEFTIENVKEFAKSISRDPGIVVGRLQKDNYISFSDYKMNQLKHKYVIV